jgi:hypothetical protein
MELSIITFVESREAIYTEHHRMHAMVPAHQVHVRHVSHHLLRPLDAPIGCYRSSYNEETSQRGFDLTVSARLGFSLFDLH